MTEEIRVEEDRIVIVDERGLSKGPDPDLSVLPPGEEKESLETVRTIDEAENIFILEANDITKTSEFVPTGTDDGQKGKLPIRGRGRLESMSIIASDGNYDVTVWIDDFKIIDDSFFDLEAISEELTHVSAYFDEPRMPDGNVITVSDYPFNEYFSTVIRPRGEITFELIRIEALIEDG